ncbi:MAG: YggS family pyridoxal phosphate-dependent enzyme [Candidatus Omnitrophica bacterium]|nr:YggS family pyridoxal phosphate-dependent enzyme [Candidatus Omnitrophota bacterium]
MIADNIKNVTQRIARCCEKSGRLVDDVQLVCVTKEASVEEIDQAIEAGIRIVGESRIQDAMAKHRIIGDRVTWHLIGHLQTNKVKDAVKMFSLIHSLDSLRLAKEINKEAEKLGKVQDVLVQVNISGEETKFGIAPGGIVEFLKQLSSYRNINIKGLMTIAPEVDDAEKVRPYFRALRQLRDKINAMHLASCELSILSMGMTNDFEVAIEEGANMVRIGRAIFR